MGGDEHVHGSEMAQVLANGRRISREGVAHAIGIEHETGHALFRSEEAAFFGRTAIAGSEEVRGNFDGVGDGEEVVPRAGLAREYDVARFGILADEDFPRSESEIRRQTDSLAAAVLAKLGNFAHGSPPLGISSAPGADIYHGISQGFLKQTAERSMRMEKHQA